MKLRLKPSSEERGAGLRRSFTGNKSVGADVERRRTPRGVASGDFFAKRRRRCPTSTSLFATT